MSSSKPNGTKEIDQVSENAVYRYRRLLQERGRTWAEWDLCQKGPIDKEQFRITAARIDGQPASISNGVVTKTKAGRRQRAKPLPILLGSPRVTSEAEAPPEPPNVIPTSVSAPKTETSPADELNGHELTELAINLTVGRNKRSNPQVIESSIRMAVKNRLIGKTIFGLVVNALRAERPGDCETLVTRFFARTTEKLPAEERNRLKKIHGIAD